MALKKSQLYSSLWQSCDELRGGMGASQYKDCVLVTALGLLALGVSGLVLRFPKRRVSSRTVNG